MTTIAGVATRRRISLPPALADRGLLWKSALAVTVITAGLWTATHGVAGVGWREVAAVLRGVSLGRLAELGGIWIGGLTIYATVLSGALPGLGVRRGLLLNLSGSAVANVLPLGGAVATGLNWRMVRRWGHSDNAFLSFCVLTNALEVVTKLVLPLVALATLLTMSVPVPHALWGMVVACAALALLLALTPSLVLRLPVAAATDRRWRTRLGSRLRDPATRISALLRVRWTRLMPGSIAYVAAQVLLLLLSLRAVGLAPSLAIVLMAAAIERLGSLIPITPAGMGIAEIGTVAWLVANGLDPVGVVAGVLLYRVFLVALEIPVGAVLLGGWAWHERRHHPRLMTEPEVAP